MTLMTWFSMTRRGRLCRTTTSTRSWTLSPLDDHGEVLTRVQRRICCVDVKVTPREDVRRSVLRYCCLICQGICLQSIFIVIVRPIGGENTDVWQTGKVQNLRNLIQLHGKDYAQETVSQVFTWRWSSEGAWLRGMNSGHREERKTSRDIKNRDMGPVHRVWYK